MHTITVTPKVEIATLCPAKVNTNRIEFTVESKLAFNFLWAAVLASIWHDNQEVKHHFRVSLETVQVEEQLPDSASVTINQVMGVKVGQLGEDVYICFGTDEPVKLEMGNVYYNIIEPLFRNEQVDINFSSDVADTVIAYEGMTWTLFENYDMYGDEFDDGRQFILVSNTGLIIALEQEMSTGKWVRSPNDIWNKFNLSMDKNFPGWVDAIINLLENN